MHSLIIGMTESGKTTLAKIIANQLSSQGKSVAVLDPVYDSAWPEKAFKADNPADFSQYLREHRSVYAFVDESGSVFNEGNDNSYQWFATTSRHYGHSAVFIAQRAIQVPKTMRDQCSRLFLFTSSRSDGKIHADEWNKPSLEECNALPQFHFYKVDRYSTGESCILMAIRDHTAIYKVEKPTNDPGSVDTSIVRSTGIHSNGVGNRKINWKVRTKD